MANELQRKESHTYTKNGGGGGRKTGQRDREREEGAREMIRVKKRRL